MRSGFGLIMALATLLLLAPGVAAQQGTVTGRVVDSRTASPIQGAQVQLLAAGEASSGGLSDPAGRFRFNAAAGAYAMEVSFIGRTTHRVERVVVTADEVTDLGVIALDQSALATEGFVVSVTPGSSGERALEAPSHVAVVGEVEIEERATTTPVDHLRATPGVDIITQGVQATNVVVRGFNNIFSGALHALTDHRLAGVPSLRVNLLHFVPANNEDIQRMEVVLGPGSALYGPNTANGVLHILTKSPLTHQGTTVSLGYGMRSEDTGLDAAQYCFDSVCEDGGLGAFERSVQQFTFRTAHLLSDEPDNRFGIKLSGQFLTGKEWFFEDEGEVLARQEADANPTEFKAELSARGFSEYADEAFNRVGVRDFDMQRWGLEARADWQFDETGTFVGTVGRTSATGIELTGLGAGQTQDWIYSFYQARVSKDRFFAQAYLNTSDAGDSFLLRDGLPLVDKSKLFVAQVQHGFSMMEGQQSFTYGVDWFKTMPDTEGTINGWYEDDDDMTEVGGYVQSETAISDQLDLVGALRFDKHSRLEDGVWSPRAAMVFKPDENQAFRFTFNRAFSTPTALNFFLDLSGGRAPNDQLAALGYRVRAQGTSDKGFTLIDENGNVYMRSPFTPAALGGPSMLLPADVSVMWPLALGAAQALAADRVPPEQLPVINALFDVLNGLSPTSADIGVLAWNPLSGSPPAPLGSSSVQNVAPIAESNTTTFEVGYQGILGDKVSLAADLWYAQHENFVSPLVVKTPLVLLNPEQAADYSEGPVVQTLTGLFILQGLDPATAAATAQGMWDAPQAQGGLGALFEQAFGAPTGVVSSSDIDASGADLLVTYENVGDVGFWGADVAFEAFLDDRWTLGGTASWVEKDYFFIEDGDPISLNAPTFKGSLSLAFREGGFNAEGRFRHIAEFPAQSAGYVGTGCITDPDTGQLLQTDPCVEAKSLVDLTLGYQVPRSNATLQLSVNDLFDTGYASFVGVPEIGRFIMLRLKYDLN